MDRTTTDRHLVAAIDEADRISVMHLAHEGERQAGRRLSRRLNELRRSYRSGTVSATRAMTIARRTISDSGLAGDLQDIVVTALEYGADTHGEVTA